MDITTILYIVAVVGYSLYKGYANRKAQQQQTDKSPRPAQEAENTELPEWMKEIFGEVLPQPPVEKPNPKPAAEPLPVKPMKKQPQKTYETLEDYRPEVVSLEKTANKKALNEKENEAAAHMQAESAIYHAEIRDMGPHNESALVNAEDLRKGIIYGEIINRRY